METQDKIYKWNVMGRALINQTSYCCVTYMGEPSDEKNYLGLWFKRFHCTLARVKRQNGAARIMETKKQRHHAHTSCLSFPPFGFYPCTQPMESCHSHSGNSLQKLFLSVTTLMMYPQVCFSHLINISPSN